MSLAENTPSVVRRRLVLLSCAGVLWSAGIGWRLYDLQVERHEEFRARADRQQQSIVELSAPRGTVYDARGRELAVSVRAHSIYADPSMVEDAQSAAEQLAAVLGVDAGQLRRRLERSGEFVMLQRRVEPAVARSVEKLGIRGIGLLEESGRAYPRGSLAAAALGFVGTDGHGLAGLESAWEEVVAGRAVRRRVLRDANRNLVIAPAALSTEAEAGNDLHLTLDASLQYVAEKELERAVAEWDARGGSVVLLDARDSAILAIASSPGFDPNQFSRYPESSWRNRAVMDAYEPGSTFKMVTAAAALETLSIHPDDRLDCEMGGITLDDTYIRDHKPFGVLTFREVIQNSSNVGVIKTALRTGTDALYEATRAFGFGRRSGVDLPGESAGIVRTRERWEGLATAYASFGHGLSVTPLQLANAYAALASGALSTPYIVREIGVGERRRRVERPAARPLPYSRATRETLVRLLEGVVEQGTGKRAAVRGYRVAGKTGTAEKSDRHGYSATGRVASFVGFAPSRRPRLVCAVMIDEPRRSHGGGVVAAPVFSRVVGEALLYLGVAPMVDDVPQTARFVRLPSSPRALPPEGSVPRSGFVRAGDELEGRRALGAGGGR